MKGISWLNYLKLRLTYGVNGNVDQSSTTYFVARYRTLSTDPTNTQYLNYSDDNLPNPKLRWEKTSTFNIGVDFRLFNNILSGSLEYYNRIGDDLLVVAVAVRHGSAPQVDVCHQCVDGITGEVTPVSPVKPPVCA